MRGIYNKLLKIKNPVLLEVKAMSTSAKSRYRILYPNGKCEFVFIKDDYYCNKFFRSCFNYNWRQKAVLGLAINVVKMADYDKAWGLKIVKVMEIK